jgi:L-ascorbate metabolism protein UlaG (beta-lactamase superfamily)
MSLERLTHSLAALDASPPSFDANPTRREAFLEIGRFLEASVRAGQAFDLRTHNPNPVWLAIEPRLARALRSADESDLARNEVVAWQMYNDGVIVRTDEIAIGLDVIPMPRFFGWPDPPGLTERTAELLDLLVITHAHEDHYDRALVRACLHMGKPVLMPEPMAVDWGHDSNLHAVSHGWKLEIDDLQITGRVGCHVWRDTPEELPLVYYEIRCQEGYAFIFGGDVDYTKEFEKTRGRAIDLLFLPWRNPNPAYEEGRPEQVGSTFDAVQIALKKIEPAALLYEHCAELDHIYGGFPASFDMALDLKRRIPVPSELMFWGEQIALTPHT